MKKEGLILLALVLVFGFVVLGCGSTSEIPIKEPPPPPPEPPTSATVYLGNGAAGTLAAGFTVGGSGYKEIVLLFNAKITDFEVEVTYTMGVNANITPASTTLIPWGSGNEWGAGARTPIYGNPSPVTFTETEANTDVIKITRSADDESTLTALSVKVAGEDIDLTVGGDWSDYVDSL